MRTSFFAFFATALLASPAAAGIPPVGWQGPKWTGPGLLCQSSFTFALKEGELAQQQYPSVGLIRYTVKSDSGSFEIAEDWATGRVYEDRELFREAPGGSVFKLTDNERHKFLFVPTETKLPFLLGFDSDNNGVPDAAGEVNPDVLDRLTFTQKGREGCLQEAGAPAAAGSGSGASPEAPVRQ